MSNPPPLLHFDYDEIEDCTCELCSNYRETYAQYVKDRRPTEGHKKTCRCDACKQMRSSWITCIAASNKRDMYSELSFLSHNHETKPVRQFGLTQHFLEWAWGKTRDAAYKTRGWWAIHSEQKALGTWISEYQRQHVTERLWAVSGFC